MQVSKDQQETPLLQMEFFYALFLLNGLDFKNSESPIPIYSRYETIIKVTKFGKTQSF